MGSRGPLPGSGKKSGRRQPPRGKLPGPPDELSEIGKREYERLAKEHAQTLAGCDHALLVMYCQAYGEVVGHEACFTEQGDSQESPVLHGSKGAVLNPRVRALDMAAARLDRAAKALGITPEARIRLAAAGQSDDNDESASDTPKDGPLGPKGFRVMAGNG